MSRRVKSVLMGQRAYGKAGDASKPTTPSLQQPVETVDSCSLFKKRAGKAREKVKPEAELASVEGLLVFRSNAAGKEFSTGCQARAVTSA
ncbi:hypothetical protein JCM15519_35820 [Fundidesulfovibrio butyratiphilus]